MREIDRLIQRRIKSGGLGEHTHLACLIQTNTCHFFGQNNMRPNRSIHAEQDLLYNIGNNDSCKKRVYFGD